jgi:hypothetical protein
MTLFFLLIFLLDPSLTFLTIPLFNGVKLLFALIFQFIGTLRMHPASVCAFIIAVAFYIEVTDHCPLALAIESGFLGIGENNTLWKWG